MINSIVLVGRTTKDIELKENKNGKCYVQFTLAVNRLSKEEQADFIPCVAWNKTAETMAKYVHKGTMIGVEGRLQVRNYEEVGIRKYISEVLVSKFTFLELRKSSIPEPIEPVRPASLSEENFHTANYQSPFQTATTMVGRTAVNVSDDDFPF